MEKLPDGRDLGDTPEEEVAADELMDTPEDELVDKELDRLRALAFEVPAEPEGGPDADAEELEVELKGVFPQ